MPIGAIVGGLIGGSTALRGGHAIATTVGSKFLRGPLIQGGQFGIGYTSGAYGGYGATNTWDPFGLHKPKYKHYQQNIRLPYGSYGRYRSYRRYSRYRGYRRRSYRSYNPYRRYRRSYY